ncbi:MAG: hypothetical protein ACK2T0_12165 [Anaerolineales bacterium]|jgi:hypothetical protein
MRHPALWLSMLLVILACGVLPSFGTVAPTQVLPATQPTPAAQSSPTIAAPTEASATGTVTGRLSYPSSFIPPMRVVFFSVPEGHASWVDTAMNQGTYSIELPTGTYHAVAYPYSADTYTAPAPGGPTLAGGYTAAVPCGLTVDCTDHTLLPITVTAGQTVPAEPGDWYAPEGSFPPMPAP